MSLTSWTRTEYCSLHAQDSLQRQEWLNSYEAKHGGTAMFGVNRFSDLTPEEFKGEEYSSFTIAQLS